MEYPANKVRGNPYRHDYNSKSTDAFSRVVKETRVCMCGKCVSAQIMYVCVFSLLCPLAPNLSYSRVDV